MIHNISDDDLVYNVDLSVASRDVQKHGRELALELFAKYLVQKKFTIPNNR